jgi:hypothetical protein
LSQINSNSKNIGGGGGDDDDDDDDDGCYVSRRIIDKTEGMKWIKLAAEIGFQDAITYLEFNHE